MKDKLEGLFIILGGAGLLVSCCVIVVHLAVYVVTPAYLAVGFYMLCFALGGSFLIWRIALWIRRRWP